MIDLNVNHLSRVLMAYRLENFAQAVSNFENALGMKFDGPKDLKRFGLRVAMSLPHGIEIIAPLDEGLVVDQVSATIDKKGEGVIGVIYRVADLKTGEERAAAAGWPRCGERIECLDVNPEWQADFEFMSEAFLGSISGVEVTLVQAIEKTTA